MKIKSWLAILVAIIIVIVLTLILYPNNSSEENINDKTVNVNYDKLNEVVFDVVTKPVIKGDLILYTNANGIIKASEELEITPNISGTIKTLNIYEGKQVKKGDLLIELDNREYEIALNEAISKVTEARLEYGFLAKESGVENNIDSKSKEYQEKLEALEKEYTTGKIDESKYNDLKNELEMKLIFSGAKRDEIIQNKSGLTSAINNYKRAKLNLEYTKIVAPFSGQIGDFNLVVGQRVSTGQKLCKLFNTATLNIDVGVLESDISKISIGNHSIIEIPSLNNEKFYGSVSYISPYIDKETKTCKVTIRIQNQSNKIKSGMFAKVLIENENLKNRILIPKEALLVRDKRTLVFTVENNLAKWKYVKIRKQNEQYIEIVEGLEPGENVIIEGQYNLAHDAKVKVIK
ncbi:MAG: efflux RND transporter periplasmic adaptor subunit [Stygiobacter sp.]